ncbi:methyltransferase domain-containing protein [Micromonospora sp. NPDC049204]|uniref:class I SAM-dependent methyltransferase n=1 Tax=unclassified Micromonospora TaxID=2617518 RepID=UPI0033C9EE47
MSTESRQKTELLDFYRPQGDGEPNLFEIWEKGGARGDSVTPSTYSTEYRGWMTDILVNRLETNRATGLLSLGCGNAVVEADTAKAGYRVLAVDALEEAVDLARAKGLEAVQADLNTWTPEEKWSVVYMDGVLGHLYDPENGLQSILKRILTWLEPGPAGVASFVASNDDTRNGSWAQAASNVTGFYWLSAGYLGEQALAAGFDRVEIQHFHYRRPQSGPRRRSVVVAQLHA